MSGLDNQATAKFLWPSRPQAKLPLYAVEKSLYRYVLMLL